jgi:hypothetical protein
MLPELQQMRELARLLQIDIRLALAEERHDDALRGIQAGIRLGEVAGSATPVIIGRLVGIAIHGVMLEQVRTAIATPNAPNYYWALATLPESLWDMRGAIEFELNAMPRLLTSVRTLPDEALEPSAWRERLLSCPARVQSADGNGEPTARRNSRMIVTCEGSLSSSPGRRDHASRSTELLVSISSGSERTRRP